MGQRSRTHGFLLTDAEQRCESRQRYGLWKRMRARLSWGRGGGTVNLSVSARKCGGLLVGEVTWFLIKKKDKALFLTWQSDPRSAFS